MKVRITENSRVSILDFASYADFIVWLNDQTFNSGEQINFINSTHEED